MNVFFGKAEIQNIHDMGIFAYSHQEVVRFNISMQDALLMQSLNSIDHLITQL